MAIKDIKTLKEKFSDGNEPHGGDFADIFDSYIHKSTKLPQSQIVGLKEIIESSTRGLIYQNPVINVSDLTTTYPKPQLGWAAMVTVTGYIYSFNGTTWANTGLKRFPDDLNLDGGGASATFGGSIVVDGGTV